MGSSVILVQSQKFQIFHLPTSLRDHNKGILPQKHCHLNQVKIKQYIFESCLLGMSWDFENIVFQTVSYQPMQTLMGLHIFGQGGNVDITVVRIHLYCTYFFLDMVKS